jgi:hypothetical protein
MKKFLGLKILFIKFWNLGKLSRNEGIPWTEDFFNNFIEHHYLVWRYLSFNKSLPWSLDFISKYQDKWDWDAITKNEGVIWSEKMIDYFKNKINWKVVYQSKTFPLTLDYFINNPKEYKVDYAFFKKIEKYITPYLDDNLIEELINETKKKESFNK